MTNSKTKTLVFANWKMNLTVGEAVKLTKSLIKPLAKVDYAEVVLIPSFTAIPSVGKVIGNKIKMGAQDIFWKDRGAFTGEISPVDLIEAGVGFVLIGHSERRLYLKETNAMVSAKVLSALAHGLKPVICVGETFVEREQGIKDQVITEQVQSALRGVVLNSLSQITIAYEPVWVIGTGHAVNPDEASATAQLIKDILLKMFSSAQVNKNFKIIYGGSVDANSVRQFVSGKIITGVLVGGASVKSSEFISLVKELNI